MEEIITVKSINYLCVVVITYIFGFLAKKYNWIESKYIPMQNLLIGLSTGILSFLTGLNENLVISIVGSLICSMSAGGIYDFSKTRKDE